MPRRAPPSRGPALTSASASIARAAARIDRNGKHHADDDSDRLGDRDADPDQHGHRDPDLHLDPDTKPDSNRDRDADGEPSVGGCGFLGVCVLCLACL